MILVEIYCLISSQNFVGYSQWYLENADTIKPFLKAALEFSLFAISFEKISQTCMSLENSAKYLAQIKKSALVIIEKFNIPKNQDILVDQLFQLLSLEVGLNFEERTAAFRVIHTLNDPIKSNRICFLVDQLRFLAILHKQPSYPTSMNRVYKLLFEILYLCNAPAVVKSVSAAIDCISTQKLAMKVSFTSSLNDFEFIVKQPLSTYSVSTSKVIQIPLKTSQTTVVDFKKSEDYFDGKLKASVLTNLIGKMGQFLTPGTDISDDKDISVEDIWKLIDMPIIQGKLPANSSNGKFFTVLLHQSSETNFVNLVKLLYHYDQFQEIFPVPPIEDYKKFKDLQKSKASKAKKPLPTELIESSEGILYESSFYRTFESTLETVPNTNIISQSSEATLPVGWYLNSIRNYEELQNSPKKDKKFPDKRKPPSKTWNVTDLAKLSERCRVAIEKLPEPKAEDTEEVKKQFVKDYIGLLKLAEICNMAISMVQLMNKFGVVRLPFKFSKEKAEEFSVLFEHAVQGKLKPLSYDGYCKEVKQLMATKDAKETMNDTKTENMHMSICNVLLYYQLKDIIDKIFPLNAGNYKINQGLNHNSIISSSLLTGSVRSHFLDRVSTLLRECYLDKTTFEESGIGKIIELSMQNLKIQKSVGVNRERKEPGIRSPVSALRLGRLYFDGKQGAPKVGRRLEGVCGHQDPSQHRQDRFSDPQQHRRKHLAAVCQVRGAPTPRPNL
jgi:hypothetical protein